MALFYLFLFVIMLLAFLGARWVFIGPPDPNDNEDDYKPWTPW